MIQAFSEYNDRTEITVPEHTGRELRIEYEDRMFFHIAGKLVRRFIIPLQIRRVIIYLKAIPYIIKGLKCLLSGKLEVSVLDATSIAVSLLRGDHATASNVMFLLEMGEMMEDWTHKKTVDDLARAMSLNVDKVWLLSSAGQEVLSNISDVKENDRIVVRTGTMIPLDGVVLSGDACVNQAAMIEESEKLKSESEAKAAHLADRLVPYTFGATLLTWLFTRNATKATSILMVDFCCALKLAMPISVLSAMREAYQSSLYRCTWHFQYD